MFKKLFLLMNILVITNVMGDEDEIEIQRTLPMTLNGNSLSLEGSASRDFCYLSIEAYHPKTKKRKATYGSLVANYNDELETMDLEELRVSNLCQGNGLGTILFNNACENLKSLEHTKMTWKASPELVDKYDPSRKSLDYLIGFYEKNGGTLLEKCSDSATFEIYL